MPAPINAPHVKVVETREGFMPQFTVDSLLWFNLLPGNPTSDKQFAVSVAHSFDEAVRSMPSSGKTVYELA